MIPEILEKPLPQKQEGEVVEFKRRKPEQRKYMLILAWEKYMITLECLMQKDIQKHL